MISLVIRYVNCILCTVLMKENRQDLKSRRVLVTDIKKDVGKIASILLLTNAKSPNAKCVQTQSGPPGGIRTPDLQNRNLLRYPAAPRAVIFSFQRIFNNIILYFLFQ